MRSLLLQITAVTAMNLKSLPKRFWLSLSTVVAVALVVVVLLAFLAMRNGFQHTLDSAGAKDVAVILRAGSQSEVASVITQDQVRLLEEAPGIAKGSDGKYVEWGVEMAGAAAVAQLIAPLTMLVGAIIAITQTDLKRMLAYSSIAHGGFLLTGVIATNQAGLSSTGLISMVMHDDAEPIGGKAFGDSAADPLAGACDQNSSTHELLTGGNRSSSG